NGANIGSSPNGFTRTTPIFVVEMYTTSFLVFSATSTTTVRRRFSGESPARSNGASQKIAMNKDNSESDRARFRIGKPPDKTNTATIPRLGMTLQPLESYAR